ncbi:hypothetical protein ACFE04_024114 [Oxalis oulophora]
MSSLKPSTAYGTISTTTLSPSSSSSLTFISRARQTTERVISTRRPWHELLDYSAISRPCSYRDALTRVKRNFDHFCPNYVMIMLFILFCSLIYHPVSMIVFIVVSVAWIALYFARNDPSFVVYGLTVDDRLVLGVLSLVTVLGLVITHVGLNVFVSLVIGVVVVGLHAAFRGTDDLFLDEEGMAEGGLVSVVGSESQPLRPAAGFTYTRI